MNSKKFMLAIFIILSGLLAAACGSISPPGGEEAEPTEIPVVVSDIEIEAEGRIVPNESVQLSFFTNGQVEEVLVEEGDLVNAGDILARLGNREELEAGIANTEAEVLASQQALDRLYDDVDVAKADALKAVAASNRAVRDAQYSLDNFTVPTNQADLETMEAVDLMKARLDEAREIFEPYKYKSSSNATRKELKDDLEEAQSDYNTAIRRLEYETSVEESQSKLDKAVEDLQILQEGPDPENVEAAEARIKAAEATLKSANAAFDNLDLVATIDGTVVDQDLIVGQDVVAGQPVMMITDFSQMYAETDDLTEIEVVDIFVGQEVTIVPDALPEVELIGIVEKISDQFEEKRGDITYTTRILIDDFDPRLRWGMTVLITFKE